MPRKVRFGRNEWTRIRRPDTHFVRKEAALDGSSARVTSVDNPAVLLLEHLVSLSTAFDDKERVKQATDIVDLLGAYMQLRRQGSIYVGTCPWHDDHRPSLQVNPARQSWKCWVCDISGDVFSFVMRREGIEFRQALELLAERAGIQLTDRRQAKTVAGNPNDKPTLYKAMRWATDQYHEFLINDGAAQLARDYLAKRGITDNAVKQFQIGYAPNSWTWLIERSRSTSYSPEVLQACGIAAKSDRGDGWYERFRGRVMFPIIDTQNRPIAFGGRVLPEIAAKEEAESGRPLAKYINSPETKLYSKSDQLFGLNLARESLSRDRHLIIVEGYTDVIAAWLAGIENTAAVCGTSLGQRHLRVIKRFADQITLVLDGDEAGQRRANEILEIFVAASVDVRIATLPQGQDPCDYLQNHGTGEFLKLVSESVDALAHKITIETQGLDLIRDTHRANQALDQILTTIARSPTNIAATSDHRLRQQQILTRLAQRFQLDLDTIRRRLADLRRKVHQPSTATSPQKQVQDLLNARKMERDLIEIVLQESSLMDRIIENISPNQFVDGPCREIYEIMCECYREQITLDFQTLMTRLEDNDLKAVLDRLDEESQQKTTMTEIDLSTQLENVLIAFDRDALDRGQRESIEILNNPETNDQEESKILEQLFQETKQRQGI